MTQFQWLSYKFRPWKHEHQRLFRKMRRALTYDEWKTAAKELDRVEGA